LNHFEGAARCPFSEAEYSLPGHDRDVSNNAIVMNRAARTIEPCSVSTLQLAGFGAMRLSDCGPGMTAGLDPERTFMNIQ